MMQARIWIAQPYRAYRDSIADVPDRFPVHGDTLYTGRNLIKTLSIASPGLEAIEVAVKAFAVPARPRGFVYAHLRRSKALRSMLNAQKLVKFEIPTPDPVASIQYQDFGCLRRSYYICRYWPHDFNLSTLLYHGAARRPDTSALLHQLARFTIAQHDRGVLHLDYNPANILVRTTGAQYHFALVDLNRLRFAQPDMNDRISGLVRLTTDAEYMEIIGRHYAQLHGADPQNFCRRLKREQHRFATGRRRRKRSLALLPKWIRRAEYTQGE